MLRNIVAVSLQINFMTSEKEFGPFSTLTNREKEVLWLIVSEKKTKEISRILMISQSTVISHRKNMLSKLKVKNTAGLIAKCYKMGILYLDHNGKTKMHIENKFALEQE